MSDELKEDIKNVYTLRKRKRYSTGNVKSSKDKPKITKKQKTTTKVQEVIEIKSDEDKKSNPLIKNIPTIKVNH